MRILLKNSRHEGYVFPGNMVQSYWTNLFKDRRSYRLTHEAQMETNPPLEPGRQPDRLHSRSLTNASGKDRVSYLAVVEDISLSGSRTSGTPIVLSGGFTLGDRWPVFSPTGDRMAFWAWDRSYRAGFWLAAVDGSETVQVTTGGADMSPQFSPDGQRLVFESGRSGHFVIWVMDLK